VGAAGSVPRLTVKRELCRSDSEYRHRPVEA
jgi:hypothetical protein